MQIVIIGNGITGISAARILRKNSDHEITIISSETEFFFSRTALMYVYMGHMRFQDIKPYEDFFWEKNRFRLKKAYVQTIDVKEKSIHTDSGEQIHYDKLLIACGSRSNRFGWPGQDLKGVQGLYSFQDLEELEENTRGGISRAVIVGGGLIGIEMAEMLHSRHYPVTLLVRESNYWNNILPEQESAMISRHIREHGFDLRLNAHLKEITDDGNGRVKSVITHDGEEISCEVVGLTAGVSPNIEWLKDSAIHLDRGILINHHMETNIEDVYAAGDCAQFQHNLPGRKQIEQVWYTGKLQGFTAAWNMLGKQEMYNPGHWFNSAKFLDIEYQTYGLVMPKLAEGHDEFYWEHPDHTKCIHFIYDSPNQKLIGVNIFGMRMRHRIFNTWLQEGRNMRFVMEHLRAADFNPEFYEDFATQIADAWNAHTRDNITLLPAKKLRAYIFS